MLAGLPLYLIRFQVLGIPVTVLELMILTSFAAWLFYYTEFRNFIRGKYKARDYFNNRKKRIKYPFGLEIIMLLLISFAAAAAAGFNNAALGIFKAYFFEPILVFILVLNVFKPSKEADKGVSREKRGINLEKIIWPLSLSVLAVALIALLQKIGLLYSPENFWPRVTGPWEYPNALGLFIGPLIPLMAAYTGYLIFNLWIKPFNKKILTNFKISR